MKKPLPQAAEANRFFFKIKKNRKNLSDMDETNGMEYKKISNYYEGYLEN